MASGLRAKLNAIGRSVPSPAKRQEHTGGVLCRSAQIPADERLFDLSADGLRRIGWQGRRLDISRMLFLDTETTGLSGGAGTIAFLVGIGYVRGDSFIVEQYLMRDYGDEPDLLDMLSRKMSGFDAVCTFNGNHFDLPLLETRFAMNRMQGLWPELDKLDLLYPARRTWKLRIGSCRLSRIEEFILGEPRSDDLPGSEVPQRYFDYLKSGDMSLLEDIIAHNRQDIITLGTLLAHLCGLYAQPEKEQRREDLFSMGKALEHQGELHLARELYRIAAIPAPAGTLSALSGNAVAADAAWREYLLARRNRDAETMRETLERMATRRQARDRVYVELAKLYEHQYGNYRRALRYADLAAKYIPPEETDALNRRRQRLEQKIRKQSLK